MMNVDQARKLILDCLHSSEMATNIELIELLEGDENLYKRIRSRLILEDLAQDKNGVGLILLRSKPGKEASSTGPRDVFVSYKSEDLEVALRLVQELETRGISCWIAKRDLQEEGGRSFAECIVEALYKTKLLLLVFSSRSNRSSHVEIELNRALDHGIPIIPVRIEELQPTGGMEYYLSTPQWVDAVPPPVDQYIDLVVSVVQQRLLSAAGKPRQALSEAARNAFRKVSKGTSPSYSAFWLGSRFAPAVKLLHDSRKLAAPAASRLEQFLNLQFEKHQHAAGLSASMVELIQQLLVTTNDAINEGMKQAFVRNAFLQLQAAHGLEVAAWFVAGVAVSSLFSQVVHGGTLVSPAHALLESQKAFNDLAELAGMGQWDNELVQRMQVLRRRYERQPTDQGETKDAVEELAITIECYLLIGRCELGTDVMQPIIEQNPLFAMFALERYCRKNATDPEGWYLLSRAGGAEIFSGNVSLDPLFPVDKIELLATALERTIAIDKNPERLAQARALLARVSGFRKGRTGGGIAGASIGSVSREAVQKMLQQAGKPPCLPGISPEHAIALILHYFHPWMLRGDPAKAHAELQRAMRACWLGEITIEDKQDEYVIRAAEPSGA